MLPFALAYRMVQLCWLVTWHPMDVHIDVPFLAIWAMDRRFFMNSGT